MARMNPYNEFGLRVHMYCATTGMNKKELAQLAGVKYDTLIAACTGLRPGYEAVRRVTAIMDAHHTEDRKRAVR